MFLDQTQINELEKLVNEWLKSKNILAGAKITIEIVRNRVIIPGGNKSQKGNRTELRKLSEKDWTAILTLPMAESLAKALKLLKERGNAGIKRDDGFGDMDNLKQRINSVFRNHQTTYRLTHAHGLGNRSTGPYQIGVIK